MISSSKGANTQVQVYSITSGDSSQRLQSLNSQAECPSRERSRFQRRNARTQKTIKMRPSVNVILISSTQDLKSTQAREDRPGHYTHSKNEILDGRFKIVGVLGQGTFGKVLRAQRDGRTYAIKMIRPYQRYIENAHTEVKILKDINSKDPNNLHGIVQFVESFTHQEYYCLVFESLGMNLYDVLKANNYRGFSIRQVQSFFRQVLQSTKFLHSAGYTHTDLKPENIVFEVSDYTYQEKPYENTNTRIKIIDLGNAVSDKHHHGSVINTRQYRSPEVIMSCCTWDHSSDIWAIGCVMVELATGKLCFPVKVDEEHLMLIQELCGPFPRWMINRSEKTSYMFRKGHIKVSDEPAPLVKINKMKNLFSQLSVEEEFRDLILKCLQIDPKLRITSADALNHPFFAKEY